jgi:hypothetical protein
MLQLGIFAAVIVVAGLAWGWVTHQLETIAQQKVAIAECAKAREGLKSAVAESNAAVAAMERAAELRESAAQEAVDAAKAKAQVHADRAAALLNAQQKPGKSSCDSARELMGDYAMSRKAKP